MKTELPERFRLLPVQNGLPIPFFAAYVNGVPDPRVADVRKIKACWKRRVCWVCGQPLEQIITFIGGDLSVANRVFSDGPMHEVCSKFALEVCPYLACVKRDRRSADIEDKLAKRPFQTLEKPLRFGHLFCSEFTVLADGSGSWLFQPLKSAIIKIDWWVGVEKLFQLGTG